MARPMLSVMRMSPYRHAPRVTMPPKDPGCAGVWTVVVLLVMLFAVALHDAPASAPLLQAARALMGH
jgi:hypothetical protein